MTLTIIPGTRGTGGLDESFATPGGGRVQAAIASAASSTGVDFHYLYRQAKVESGLNPNARASTSSASGLYQFTNQTWLATVKAHGAEHGLSWAASAISRGADGRYHVADETTKAEILALRQDPATSAAMAGEYASDNGDYLASRLGRQANPVELYLAHFLGPAGAGRFLSAQASDPTQSAASVMPAAARANRWVFYNRDGTARSLQDVYDRFAQHFDQSGGSATPAAATATSRLAANGATRDTSVELVRMQLAALNGTDQAGDPLAAATKPAALLTPSPQTARLAYLMLASLGV